MRAHEHGQPKPAWARYVERGTTPIPPRSIARPAPAAGDWQQALVRCLEPLLASARSDLVAAGHTGAVAEQALHRLGRRLVRLTARTFVLELARARARGELAGATPAERFLAFTHRLEGGSELAEFLAGYPVLARVLGEACRQAVEGHLELLARLTEDRELLVTELLAGQDPGALTAVDPGGDPHRGGRSTATLTFANGARVVYKPRPLDLHEHFNELVGWLNTKTTLGIRTVHVLRRGEYGWLEYVAAEDCADLPGVRRFYQRQGALLALLYVLDGTDMHYENLIAAGDQPVLVDVETLFHPSITPAGVAADPAQTALLSSVSRTALLPLLVSGEHGVADLSGLGGDAGGTTPNNVVDWADAGLDTMHLVRRPGTTRGGSNRPRLDGVVMEPRDHEIAVLTGFRAAYEAIARQGGDLLGPGGLPARCARDRIRYIARPSNIYATLLDESTHPDALRSADGHAELLDLLWDSDESLRRLVPYELAELWAGDIPLFTTRPDSRDVWASDGTRIPDVLAADGLSAVEAKIAAMTEVDLHRQQWIISACLATRPEPVRHSSPANRPGLGAVEPDPEHVIAAATDLADEIMAQVLGRSGDSANWLGLELLDDHHWAVLPMGAGLSNGYTGTALFLAQIGALTGAGKYCELARDAIRPIPALLELLAANPAAAQAVGPGLHGLGGITYGLSRLRALLDDSALTDSVAAALALMESLEPDDSPGYAEGAAGGLTAVLGVPGGERLAHRYAEELVAASRSTGGFARGDGGIAWALARYGVPGDRFHQVARDAASADGAADAGWCGGTTGTVLARLVSGAPVDVDAYLRATNERPVLADLSLCHGELGTVEPLLWLTESGNQQAETVRRRRTGLVLAAVKQYGARCGTPRAVPSPGLLTGLAGIGYGLLRLGFPHQVPSALLMQPTAGRHTAPTRGTGPTDRGTP
ncbi:type 2 lantibiotic biosynthesis protein LanM [Kribbella amoyensis]|uniref:Type 2 lantibiotic biosynthesis protein LanM n=2 Tax=Kribbella amoyensis TaxID=996641 RepID=A0A561BM02_9ACTN|nr:type 2 lantibiotic biosynthesis protein LanM [Kribbella amoyensis]